jgi:hypothetical protein
MQKKATTIGQINLRIMEGLLETFRARPDEKKATPAAIRFLATGVNT